MNWTPRYAPGKWEGNVSGDTTVLNPKKTKMRSSIHICKNNNLETVLAAQERTLQNIPYFARETNRQDCLAEMMLSFEAKGSWFHSCRVGLIR